MQRFWYFQMDFYKETNWKDQKKDFVLLVFLKKEECI